MLNKLVPKESPNIEIPPKPNSVKNRPLQLFQFAFPYPKLCPCVRLAKKKKKATPNPYLKELINHVTSPFQRMIGVVHVYRKPPLRTPKGFLKEKRTAHQRVASSISLLRSSRLLPLWCPRPELLFPSFLPLSVTALPILAKVPILPSLALSL